MHLLCICLSKINMYMYVNVNYMIKIQLKPEQNRCTPCSHETNSLPGRIAQSGNRCEYDCRSRGREFDPGSVPYFRGD